MEKQKKCRIIFFFRWCWMRPFLVFVQMEFCGWLEPLISENPRSPRLSGKSQVRSSPRRKMWKATQRNADDFFGIFLLNRKLCWIWSAELFVGDFFFCRKVFSKYLCGGGGHIVPEICQLNHFKLYHPKVIFWEIETLNTSIVLFEEKLVTKVTYGSLPTLL